jgi:hypothetical protein
MNDERYDYDADYELVDEDRGPLQGLGEAELETWLRAGLEGYLLEGKGAWAFREVVGLIARQQSLTLGLRDAYRELNAEQRGAFRRAVAKVLASLEADERNVPLFEHLLALAAELPAPEVLRVLPARVGNGFFGLTDNREGESLFAATLLTVARLAAPREEVVACLHRLIGSRHFDHAFAGLALVALCRADDSGLTDHMERLREPLAAQFREFRVDEEAKRGLALSVLDAVGLEPVAEALPRLKYFDRHSEKAPLDDWLIEALLTAPGSPLGVEEDEDGGVWLFDAEEPVKKVRLHEPKKVSFDFLAVLSEVAASVVGPANDARLRVATKHIRAEGNDNAEQFGVALDLKEAA